MKSFFVALPVCWFLTTVVLAQPARGVQYAVELGGMVSSAASTPFWQRSNQYGTVPTTGSFTTVRANVVRSYKTKPDSVGAKVARFDWGFGLGAVLNVGHTASPDNPNVVLPDAYVKVRWKQIELFGGNRREVMGLGDTLLTSGFVAWSGNALPFPKVQLHTPDFVPLGFTRQVLAIHAAYAHGWFTDTYIRGSYLHQKAVYGRIGKPGWRVRFYAGLNHQVQWGGRADYLAGTPLAVDGKLPATFRDYVSVVTGRYPEALQNDRFTGFDGENRIGNHVGSYDMALEWNGRSANWLLYHQHLYEDASGLALQNVPDGLTGLRFHNCRPISGNFQVQRIVLEWVSTTNQSGPTFDQSARYQGGDNYFNHSQYRQGWSYRGRTLGTPFIAPRADLSSAVREFTGGGYFPNNRVTAGYAAFRGWFRRGPTLTVRLSYSRNAGSFNQVYPQPFRQFSGLTSAQWPLRRGAQTALITTFALDRGGLFANATSGWLALQRRW